MLVFLVHESVNKARFTSLNKTTNSLILDGYLEVMVVTKCKIIII